MLPRRSTLVTSFAHAVLVAGLAGPAAAQNPGGAAPDPYQIELTSEEFDDLAALASKGGVQSGFHESDTPEVIRDWMVDEVYQALDPDNMAT